jgi:hypothetical protein
VNIVKKPREKIVMAKKKVCGKKCSKKCSTPKKATKKVATFDNRLSSVENITASSETPGFFTQVYRYLFPAR